jgi:hypothetical protein
MKKILLAILWTILIGVNMYAQGSRYISINYQHSRRIPYNTIDIELKSENNGGKIYYIKVVTKQMKGSSGWESSNTERTISIDKKYFDDMFDRILSINFTEIVMNSENIVGTDGNTISLIFGTYQNNIKISLWSPTYKEEERRTGVLNDIIHDLFLKTGLEEWL